MKTIDYYNKYADEFTVSTFKVDMESLLDFGGMAYLTF